MHNVEHVEASLDKIREIFVKASERVEALEHGGKIPATALAEEIGSEFGLTGPQTYPVLKFLFNSYPGIIVRRGAHGGLIKPAPGTENVKNKKTKPTLQVMAANTATQTNVTQLAKVESELSPELDTMEQEPDLDNLDDLEHGALDLDN